MMFIVKIHSSTINVDNDNEKISKVIAIHLYLTAIKNMLSSTVSPAFPINGVLNVVAFLLLAICYTYLIFKTKLIKRIPGFVYIIVILILLFFGISFLFDKNLFVENVDNYFYVKRQSGVFFVYSLPLFMCCSALRNVNELSFYLRKFAPIGLIFSTISAVFYFVFKTSDVQYSMSFGNMVMLPCMVYIFDAIAHKRKIDLICSMFLTVIIILTGSRGPLVCISLAYLYFIFRFEKRVSVLRLIVGIITSIFIVFMIFNFNNMIDLAYTTLLKFGFNSRTLETISHRGLLYDSGRSLYHKTLIDSINKHPFTGLGAFGGEVTVGLSHSIYLDIFANFGYLFGMMVILFIVFIIYYYLVLNKQKELRYMCLMIALMILPRGFFDDTFWAAKELWVLFGLYFGVVLQNKTESLMKNVIIKEVVLL